jgi:lipopolysaccharide transport system permease protein
MYGLLQHGELIWTFAKRELSGRYRGSLLGMAWSFLNPLLLLGIYTFVFSVLLKVRFEGSSGPGSYVVYLFCGMIPWLAFTETIARAPQLIYGNLNLVKKTVFPLEILVVSSTLTSWIHSLFTLGVLAITAWLIGVDLWHASTPLIVLVMVPQLLLTLGLGWFLASLGVFIRDTGEIVQMALRMGMYLTPIVYPVSIIPERFRPWILVNPLAIIVEGYRDVLLRGKFPDILGLAVVGFLGVILAFLGYLWFMKSKRAFADVI